MTGARCATCGAVGKLVPAGNERGSAGGSGWRMEWRGGRIGIDKLALEDARTGVTTCPACQHRACVVMLAPRAWDDAEQRPG